MPVSLAPAPAGWFWCRRQRGGSSPVYSVVIIGSAEELDLFKGGRAGEGAGDGRMKAEEGMERRRTCRGNEPMTETLLLQGAAGAGRVPVFCGPMMRNLGSWSQVFSLDQMSLCLLS